MLMCDYMLTKEVAFLEVDLIIILVASLIVLRRIRIRRLDLVHYLLLLLN